MRRLDQPFWNGRPVLVTGHMGFKGAWLCWMLARLGARVTGFGYDHREPLLYPRLSIPGHRSDEGDVGDLPALSASLLRAEPEIAFHLAAQPIVLSSYADPLKTFQDNIMGTATVLEAVRRTPSVRAVVVVTSDKVYRNQEWPWPYRETEALGGSDPYSASKAAAEIVTQSMVASYFGAEGAARVATARAGNVIGGGDWADHRLLPDAARALTAGEVLGVRNPVSTRPWQHVLEPLTGYALLAEDLLMRIPDRVGAWNFGPAAEDAIPVSEVADLFTSAWGGGASWRTQAPEGSVLKEAHHLAVDSSLARREISWSPRWRVAEAVARTAAWYRDFAAGADAGRLMDRDLKDYLS